MDWVVPLDLTTILLFFIYTYGLGFSVTYFLKSSEDFFERHLMRVGIGLGAMVILGMLLNFLHLPVDWRIFLAASLILPAYALAKAVKSNSRNPNNSTLFPKLELKLTKSNLAVLVVLLLFAATLFMYLSGAFNYPYLEDDDPWNYAKGVKYIATEKTAFEPEGFDEKGLFQYIEPYPPGYSLVMGVLHQTSPSVSWTLKFFTSLLISLSIIFFYFFTKRFTGDRNKALFATFILAAIPCFLSHFIWSLSLVIPLFLVLMYCLLQIKEDKKWIIPSGILLASIALTHPQMVINLGIMFGIYVGIKAIYEKKFPKEELYVCILAGMLALLWWGSMLVIHGSPLSAGTEWGEIGRALSNEKPEGKWIYYKGSADRVYTFNDFFVAKPNNMINNPIGIGIVISLLLFSALISLIFSYKSLKQPENYWQTISFAWLFFAVFGVMGASLPIQFTAFRFWMLVAVTSSLVAVIGFWFLLAVGKKFNAPAAIILIVVVLGILFTSASQKYSVNTAVWPPGVKWSSMDEINGFIWLKENLPQNTKVFGFCNDKSAQHLIGFDMYDCIWCKPIADFRKNSFNYTAVEANSYLRENGYEYAVFDSQCLTLHDVNQTNTKIQELVESGRFMVAKQTAGAIILKVS